MRKLFNKVIGSSYQLLTGKKVTTNAAFLSTSFVGLAFKLGTAKLFVMLSVILTGKFLGAAEYGRLTIVLAIGTFWCLPFFTSWGLSYVKFASESTDQLYSNNLLSSALLIVLSILIFIVPLIILSKHQFSRVLDISPNIWVLGTVFGIIMGGFYFSKNIFQASQSWRPYITCEYLYSITVLIGILVLLIIAPAEKFFSVIIVFILAHAIPIFFIIKKKIGTLEIPKSENMERIGLYGLGLMISFGLSLFAMQLDKLLLNHYSDASSVGRYQAYYVSTYGVLSSFTMILNNYLLPLYGKHSKNTIKRIIKRFLIILFLPLWTFCIIIGRLTFIIWGTSFLFSWVELMWASIFSVLMFCLQVMVFFTMTLGKKALLINSVAYIAFIIAQFSLLPLLISNNGVAGAFQGMSVACLFGFIIVCAILYIAIPKQVVIENEL